MIVARLVQFGKLAGFHFNDSKYGDDDLDFGSIKPFQLFLIFHELVLAELEKVPGFDPAYMLDQSHNLTDPVESLMTSAVELVRAYVQAHLVDRAALAEAQDTNDAITALQLLKQAFTTDEPGDGRRGPRPGAGGAGRGDRDREPAAAGGRVRAHRLARRRPAARRDAEALRAARAGRRGARGRQGTLSRDRGRGATGRLAHPPTGIFL